MQHNKKTEKVKNTPVHEFVRQATKDGKPVKTDIIPKGMPSSSTFGKRPPKHNANDPVMR